MPALPGPDLTAIRSRPVGRNWKLYIYVPTVVWSGTIGGAPTQGDRELDVTTVVGDPALILADMTCRVRSATGDYKISPSKVRVKSHDGASPGEMVVAENAIDWVVGDVVTVYRLFELWPRIPYIDPVTGEQYKDRDTAWASDAQAQPPKANGGPAVIATLTGGQVDVVFTDDGSFACPGGGAVASYLWSVIGDAPAVVAGNPATATVTYRFTTAGFFYVKLQVTDANGETGHVYVPVIIDSGTMSIGEAVPGDRQWDRMGWSLSRRLVGIDADDSVWYDGAPVFLVADDSQVADAAFVANRSNLRWSGWLMRDDTDTGSYDREVSFSAVSTAHVLSNIPAYATGFRSDAAPADWYEYTGLSVNSVAYLLLRWQSTVCEVCDYHAFTEDEWSGGVSERLRPGENCDAEDLLSQINAVLNAAKGDLRCDRQGILRAQRNEWYLNAAELAARATVLTLQNGDFTHIDYGPHEHKARVRETRLSGVDGASEPYISGAPGPSPLDGGRPSETQHLAPLDQDELNQWAGQDLALKNWDAVARLKMAGEFDVVDPARGEFVDGTLSAFDSRIPDGPYSVVGVRFSDDHLLGLTIGEWLLLPTPGMYGASARPIPAEPPPPEPPPLDPLPDVPSIEVGGTGEVVVVATRSLSEISLPNPGVCYTLNAVSGNPPTWFELNTGLAKPAYVRSLCIDPNAQSFNLACVDNSWEVYVNTDWRAGANWSLALSQAAAMVLTGATSDTVIEAVYAFSYDDTTYLIASLLSDSNRTDLAYSTDWGTTWGIYPFHRTWYAGFGIYATCSYYPSREALLSKYSSSCAGQLASAGGRIYIGGRGPGSTGRSCISTRAFDPVTPTIVPCFRPSTADPTCPECIIPFSTIGGFRGASEYRWGGPGGMCADPSGSYVYVACWIDNADTNPAVPYQFCRSLPAGGDLTVLYEQTQGYGTQNGMVFTAPIGSGEEYVVLQVDSVTKGTTVTIGTGAVRAAVATIDIPCRNGKAFSTMLGEFALLYLGRSWDKTKQETTQYTDEKDLFLISKLVAADMGAFWTDKTGNLGDLGVVGITDIVVDETSD